MLPRALALVTLLTAGCPSSPPSPFSFDGAQDVRLAYAAHALPYTVPFTVTSPPSGAPDASCPVVTSTGPDAWTAEGGCTDARGVRFEGRYAGRAEAVAAGSRVTLAFEGFAVSAPAFSLRIDGRVVAVMADAGCGFAAPAPLAADGLTMTLTGDAVEGFGGFFPGQGDAVTLAWRDYAYAYASNPACAGTTIDARGEVDVEGRGTFTVASRETRLEAGVCGRRDASTGQAVFTGANVATVTRDGDAACDGCLPFAISGGAGGTLCWP